MELITTGINANSWFDIDDANVIIMSVPDRVIGFEKANAFDAFEFTPEDIPLIIESHKQISALFSFKGARANPRQRLAWPRIGYLLDGGIPTDNWFGRDYPHLDASWYPLAHHVNYDLGHARYTELASDEVPEDIKEAAAINAALMKNGYSIFEDNKGDQTTYNLGPLSGDNINAVAVANGVFERLARWGLYIGTPIVQAGGGRG